MFKKTFLKGKFRKITLSPVFPGLPGGPIIPGSPLMPRSPFGPLGPKGPAGPKDPLSPKRNKINFRNSLLNSIHNAKDLPCGPGKPSSP